MNPLINLWDWIGCNSGQLQTLLGIFAIALAIKAAAYAREQIKYAREQIQIANDQQAEDLRLTAFNLKLSVLTVVYECKELIYSIEHKHKKLEETFTQFANIFNLTINDKMPGSEYSFAEYIKNPLNELKSPKDVVNRLIEQLTNKDTSVSHKDLEMYLEHLIPIKGKIHSANEGYDRRVEDIQKIIDSIQSKYPHN